MRFSDKRQFASRAEGELLRRWKRERRCNSISTGSSPAIRNCRRPPSGGTELPLRPPQRSRCPDRRLRAGRAYAGRTACGVSRHQDPDRRAEIGPLLLGQADGIACRTMEMFEAFGSSERAVKEAYWVNETSFWKPEVRERANIVRSGRVQDVEDGLSEFPHVILNQARAHHSFWTFCATLRRGWSRTFPPIAGPHDRRTGGERNESAATAHPFTVKLKRLRQRHEGQVETVKARYVVGCDGARSAVRQSLGLALHRGFRQPVLGRHGCAGD